MDSKNAHTQRINKKYQEIAYKKNYNPFNIERLIDTTL
jgi:hypothetical protein